MPRIKYATSAGVEYEAEVPVGSSVMEGALRNGVPGITADCGGACACATCSVRVDDAWVAVVGAPSDLEAALLEYSAAAELGGVMRLSCQMKVVQAYEGLVVHLPEHQL